MTGSDFTLQETGKGIPGQLLLIILDGVGLYDGRDQGYDGNALDLADAPVLKGLLQNAPLQTRLRAHGTAVGLPDDTDMGNSEVGHNAIGAGRIFPQGALLVNEAVQSRELFRQSAWNELIGTRENPGLALKTDKKRAVHFLGLLSDGNVHSHIDHLLALIEQCHSVGVERIYVHALLDGRDVEEKSAHIYIEKLEGLLKQYDPSAERYAIASGGGRMIITMDRYEADWNMVEKGWKIHVKGEGRFFESALEAVQTYREESNHTVIDQNLPPFVIAKDGKPVGPIRNDDIVIFYNFRGDRAIEISRAFTEKEFTPFVRDPEVNVNYAGMMEYDGDLGIPPRYIVERSLISRTVSEYLASNNVRQYAISETQKFGHVTYFWNGNNSEKFNEELETWVEIKSDIIPFDQKPEMKANEITDALLEALEGGEYKFLRVNFANGDMVGHTGVLRAAVSAMETVDKNLDRLLKTALETNTTVIITADHGNCDQMYLQDQKGNVKKDPTGKPIPKTSHTLAPVPFILTGANTEKFRLDHSLDNPGLANIASTILTILGYVPPEDYEPAVFIS